MEPQLKTIEVVFSERGDSWIEELKVEANQTIREVLKKRGFEKFIVGRVDADNPNVIQDGMSINVKVYS